MLCTQVPLETLQAHPQYPRLIAGLRQSIAAGKMKARQLANTLWACAKLGDAHMDGVVDEIMAAMVKARLPPQGFTALHVCCSLAAGRQWQGITGHACSACSYSSGRRVRQLQPLSDISLWPRQLSCTG